MPKLPNAERAVVEIKKLRNYSLNPQHKIGKHKARVFFAALGITLADAEWLREVVLRIILDHEASDKGLSPFGHKYVVDAMITRGERQALMRTAWIIDYGTDFPRLTSCYVKK